METVMQDIALAELLYQQDRLSESYTVLQRVDLVLASPSPEDSVFDDEFLRCQAYEQLRTSTIVSIIRQVGAELVAFLKMVKDADAWRTWIEPRPQSDTKHSIRVSTHRDEEYGHYFFKVEGTLHDIGLIPIVASFLEIDLFSTWMPLVKESEVLEALSKYKRMLKATIDLVLLKRDALLVG
jgi:hypothetical protein